MRSVKWSNMLEALDHEFCVLRYLLWMVNNYIRDRALLYGTLEGQQQMAGLGQSSVLGPDLWN